MACSVDGPVLVSVQDGTERCAVLGHSSLKQSGLIEAHWLTLRGFYTALWLSLLHAISLLASPFHHMTHLIPLPGIRPAKKVAISGWWVMPKVDSQTGLRGRWVPRADFLRSLKRPPSSGPTPNPALRRRCTPTPLGGLVFPPPPPPAHPLLPPPPARPSPTLGAAAKPLCIIIGGITYEYNRPLPPPGLRCVL